MQWLRAVALIVVFEVALPAQGQESTTQPDQPATSAIAGTALAPLPASIDPGPVALPATMPALTGEPFPYVPSATTYPASPSKAASPAPVADPVTALPEPSPASSGNSGNGDGNRIDTPAEIGASAGVNDAAIATPKVPLPLSLWQRIRSGFKMPTIDDPLVRKWESFYAARPEYWQRINDRGKRYLHFITREIERRGMPLEIALLPVIESAYNPEALSRAHALGIWQFVPATGKMYGLQQNWWFDDRRDVSVATSGALDYLEKLHVMFGDWQLALAAYNWGEGAVGRAIARNRAEGMPTDYANLRIPAETRNYLPKLQAVKNVVMEPERFALSLPEVPDAPYFVTVTTPRQIDVALAAKLAGMPLEDFKILNPAHNRPVMAGIGDQRINLPSDKAEAFVMNLDSYRKPLVSWRPYQVKQGERLDKLAPQFGIDIDELKRVNGLMGRKRLVPGYTLLVPAKAGATVETLQLAAFKEAPNDGPGWHKVRRGENLSGIAQRYGVAAADIKRLNGLTANAAPAGRKLRLYEGVSLGTSSKAKSAAQHGTRKRVVKPHRKR